MGTRNYKRDKNGKFAGSAGGGGSITVGRTRGKTIAGKNATPPARRRTRPICGPRA